MTGTLRRAHVVALVVAAVVLAAAAVFMVVSISDRDSASGDARSAVGGRVEQRAGLQDSRDQLVAARSGAAAMSNAFRQVLALEEQLAATMSQVVDADAAAQQLGSSENPDVARYNAAIDDANAMADQYNATIAQIRQLIQAIPRQVVEAGR
jgi:hypothetical protein